MTCSRASAKWCASSVLRLFSEVIHWWYMYHICITVEYHRTTPRARVDGWGAPALRGDTSMIHVSPPPAVASSGNTCITRASKVIHWWYMYHYMEHRWYMHSSRPWCITPDAGQVWWISRMIHVSHCNDTYISIPGWWYIYDTFMIHHDTQWYSLIHLWSFVIHLMIHAWYINDTL